MTEPELPFELYETPDPPSGLVDEVAARVKRSQRAEIVSKAARRQSRWLTVATSAALLLAVAVVVLLVVVLRDSGSQVAVCSPGPTVLGGGPGPVADDEAPVQELHLAAARTLRSPGAIRQFESAQARARAAREIARARKTRLASSQGRARPAGQPDFELTDTAVRAELERISEDLAECYVDKGQGGDRNGDLALALSVAGEPGHGSLVEEVAVSAVRSLPPGQALVECVTQTLLSLRFPSPRAGGRVLVAYALPAPALRAEEDEVVVGASRPRPDKAQPSPEKVDSPPDKAEPAPENVEPPPASDAEAEALVTDAREAAKGGRFGEALRLAERALQRNPHDQDALMVAVIASCNARAAHKAAKYIPRLQSEGRRGMAGAICEKVIGYNPAAASRSSERCPDEVACLLADTPPACCKQYGKPERLDQRADISAGMSPVRARVSACGKQHDDTGKVQVKITVAPSGKVTDVAVEQAPSKALGACVAAAVERATFPATRQGGSFVYPFVFR